MPISTQFTVVVPPAAAAADRADDVDVTEQKHASCRLAEFTVKSRRQVFVLAF